MDSAKWSVVEFQDGIQVVAKSWIQGDQCYWPKINCPLKYEKMVSSLEPPNENWRLYPMSVLGEYGTFEKAKKKLLLAQEQTELSSDEETRKRKRKVKHKKVVSSSDDEEIISSPVSSKIKPFPAFPPTKKQKPNTAVRRELELTPANSSFRDTEEAVGEFENTPNSSSHDLVLTDRELKLKISRDLSDIKIKLVKLSQAVESLQSANNFRVQANENVEDTIRQDSDDIDLTKLNEKSELEDFEKKLADEDFKVKVVRKLSGIGGHKPDETTKLILRRILSDQLAAKYSWAGMKKKSVFENLRIASIILSIVQKRHSVTERDVIACIKNWLRHAPTRAKHDGNKQIAPPADENPVV